MEIKEGVFLSKNDKKFLVCKVNKSFSYLIEITKEINPVDFYNKFKSKPKSFKMDQFCKITGMFKQKIDSSFKVLEDTPLISDKQIESKKTGVSPCCSDEARSLYVKKHYSGMSYCKKCGKNLTIVKLEDDDWLLFRQKSIYYQVNLRTRDVKFKMEMKQKKC